MKKIWFIVLIVTGACFFPVASGFAAEGNRIFIIDRQGERWDVTEAKSIGFDPDKFQYGLGKDAIMPLNEALSDEAGTGIPPLLRIIGIEKDGAAQAYSVSKLGRHEIANSRIGSEPIAVGY